MKVIYKYPLTLNTMQSVTLPKNSKILSAQIQNGQLFIWALVDPGLVLSEKKILVLDTGTFFNDNLIFGFIHIDTVQDGHYVWHIFAEWIDTGS